MDAAGVAGRLLRRSAPALPPPTAAPWTDTPPPPPPRAASRRRRRRPRPPRTLPPVRDTPRRMVAGVCPTCLLGGLSRPRVHPLWSVLAGREAGCQLRAACRGASTPESSKPWVERASMLREDTKHNKTAGVPEQAAASAAAAASSASGVCMPGHAMRSSAALCRPDPLLVLRRRGRELTARPSTLRISAAAPACSRWRRCCRCRCQRAGRRPVNRRRAAGPTSFGEPRSWWRGRSGLFRSSVHAAGSADGQPRSICGSWRTAFCQRQRRGSRPWRGAGSGRPSPRRLVHTPRRHALRSAWVDISHDRCGAAGAADRAVQGVGF